MIVILGLARVPGLSPIVLKKLHLFGAAISSVRSRVGAAVRARTCCVVWDPSAQAAAATKKNATESNNGASKYLYSEVPVPSYSTERLKYLYPLTVQNV